jgi:hypothetical protein
MAMVAVVGCRIGLVSFGAYVGNAGRGDCLVARCAAVAMVALYCGWVGVREPYLARFAFPQ